MKFITGNTTKFTEMQRFFPYIQQLDIDLPEIQSLDPQEIIAAKIQEAQKYVEKGEEIIVEDTSVYFNEMNNLPGPFIKFFLSSLGTDGIWNIAQHFQNKTAVAKTMIGYADAQGTISYFEGVVQGTIVEPGEVGFGWNPLFQADGTDKNFAEMDIEERMQYSMRAKAAEKLQIFLQEKSRA